MSNPMIVSVKKIKNGKARYVVKSFVGGEWIIHRAGNCGSWDRAKSWGYHVALAVREGRVA